MSARNGQWVGLESLVCDVVNLIPCADDAAMATELSLLDPHQGGARLATVARLIACHERITDDLVTVQFSEHEPIYRAQLDGSLVEVL